MSNPPSPFPRIHSMPTLPQGPHPQSLAQSMIKNGTTLERPLDYAETVALANTALAGICDDWNIHPAFEFNKPDDPRIKRIAKELIIRIFAQDSVTFDSGLKSIKTVLKNHVHSDDGNEHDINCTVSSACHSLIRTTAISDVKAALKRSIVACLQSPDIEEPRSFISEVDHVLRQYTIIQADKLLGERAFILLVRDVLSETCPGQEEYIDAAIAAYLGQQRAETKKRAGENVRARNENAITAPLPQKNADANITGPLDRSLANQLIIHLGDLPLNDAKAKEIVGQFIQDHRNTLNGFGARSARALVIEALSAHYNPRNHEATGRDIAVLVNSCFMSASKRPGGRSNTHPMQM